MSYRSFGNNMENLGASCIMYFSCAVCGEWFNCNYITFLENYPTRHPLIRDRRRSVLDILRKPMSCEVDYGFITKGSYGIFNYSPISEVLTPALTNPIASSSADSAALTSFGLPERSTVIAVSAIYPSIWTPISSFTISFPNTDLSFKHGVE